MTRLIRRWVMAVAELDDEKCKRAVEAIQAARADRPGDHWRHPLEREAFKRCVENGGRATADIRASVLHAQLTATNLSQLEDHDGA